MPDASADVSTPPLAGRAAVVTGATGGIGRAIALELARQGADVLVHGFRHEDAAKAVTRSIGECGRKTNVVLADVSNIAGCDQLAQAAWDWQGGVDIWVNNAGADVLTGDAPPGRSSES